MMSFNSPRRMRELLAADGPIIRMGISDPLMARIAQSAGFDSVVLSGYAQGATAVRPEPLLDLTQLAADTTAIQGAIDIPLMIDAGACFGEPMHVWNTVRRLERTGAAGLQMEDQVFPKRAHYHRNYEEQTISQEEMIDKIQVAAETRRDPNFVIVGRSDSMKTVGYDEGVRRANAYAEAGADVVMVWPNTMEEVERAPRDIKAPLAYVVTHGNRVGRPTPPVDELVSMGYKVISYATLGILTYYLAVFESFREIREKGDTRFGKEDLIKARKDLEALIGLDELYKIEERTVLRANAAQ